MPVICNFVLIEEDSKSVKVQGTREYFPLEKFTGKVGRNGNVFSLCLIFVEIGLGQKVLKHQIKSGLYMDIATNLDQFLIDKFPCSDVPFFYNWCSYCKLHKIKLNEAPNNNRLNASEIWEHLKDMVGATPHWIYVSPINNMGDETDDAEIMLRENITAMFAE
jgi:hypothetical protein